MQLIQVEIYDFKSIKYEKIEIQRNQLCFVGKNECGKSSILQAISYLNVLDKQFTKNLINKKSERYPNGYPVVIGLFELSEKNYIQLTNLLEKPVKTTSIADNNKHYLELKRWGNGIENISIILSDKKMYAEDLLKNISKKAEFLSSFFEEIYPSIQLFEDEELLLEAATVDELLADDRKFETFRKLLYIGGCNDISELESDDDNFLSTFQAQIEDKFNDIFQKHYKQDKNIAINIRPIKGDKLNIIVKDASKASFSIDERSPGFRYYFSFLINKLYATEVNGDKDIILLLDEPGNNLHPQGCKDLLVSFRDIAAKSQIFYTTHNPFLTIRNDVDSLIMVEKNAELGTKIIRKTFLKKYEIMRRELGMLLNDSFLIGDINLMVEGNTEKLAFHRLFQMEKYRELEWINIYNADGVANIPQAVNYLGKNNLNLKGVIILDSDAEANAIKTKKAYKDNIDTNFWEEIEVNDAFSDKEDRTFEDLFPQDLYIAAYNEYCQMYGEIFQNIFVPFNTELPIPTPIVNKIQEHYKGQLSKENNKSTITKQDVIKNLLDNIDKLSEEEQSKALENVLKLVEKIISLYNKIQNASN